MACLPGSHTCQLRAGGWLKVPMYCLCRLASEAETTVLVDQSCSNEAIGCFTYKWPSFACTAWSRHNLAHVQGLSDPGF